MDTTQLTPEEAEQIYKEVMQRVAPEHTPLPPPAQNNGATVIRIHVDSTHLRDVVPSDYMVAVQEGQLRGILEALSYCVLDANGGYMPYEKARPIIGKLPIAKIEELAAKFSTQVEEIAVPLVSVAGS